MDDLNRRPKYATSDLMNYHYLKEIRKLLIENATDSEKALWEELRAKKTGYKFRRQHIIDNYIVDFVCLAKKLVVEIDGRIHDSKAEDDDLRTYTLNFKGFDVLRYSNEEVISNPIKVANKIKEILDNRLIK